MPSLITTAVSDWPKGWDILRKHFDEEVSSRLVQLRGKATQRGSSEAETLAAKAALLAAQEDAQRNACPCRTTHAQSTQAGKQIQI